MAKRTSARSVHVALLRGINVGGKNRLPMRDLAAIFSDLGCEDVRTYIQSGNVVYRAEPALARRVPDLVARVVAKGWGFDAPVVTRTAGELHAAAKHNPFVVRSGIDPRALHVAFLAVRPSAARVAGLDPDRSPGDEFVVRGGEIYLCLPNGVARTRLTNQYFDSKLATVSTLRNWTTVLTLCEWTGNRS